MCAGQSDQEHFPRRRHFVVGAGVFWAVALYGSLVPFDFAPRTLPRAVEQFRAILADKMMSDSRSDLVANVLLFVPIGFCLCAALAMDRGAGLRRFLMAPLVLVSCVASSVLIEFLQLWFPARVSSMGDITAQGFGALVGLVLWLVLGQSTVQWLRTFTRYQRPADKIDWLLKAYFVALVIYSLWPLDFTLSPGDLVRKYEKGGIVLVPFASARWDLEYALALASDVAVFFPVGMLAAVPLISRRRPVRPLASGLCWGAVAVLAVEGSQLFVFSRYCEAGDVLTGFAGVALGVFAMRRWRRTMRFEDVGNESEAPSRRNVALLATAAVYAVVLVLVFCAPFDEWTSDMQTIRARYEGLMRTPFATLQQGHPLNAVTQVIRKGVFFAPLGGLLALVVSSLQMPAALRRFCYAPALVAAASVALVIELLQVFLPSHVADLSDVLLCTFGSLVGMIVTVRVFARRERAP